MKKLWTVFVLVIVLSFGVLGWVGVRIYQQAPPIPRQVVTPDGAEVIDAGAIERGQNVWQALGGMQIGSVWGHGSYVAPDWSADWLHREAIYILDAWARDEGGQSYAALPDERRAALRSRLQASIRPNGHDDTSGVLTIEPVRARAFAANAAHLAEVFGRGREDYAIPAGTLTDPGAQRDLAAFVFWSAWASTTLRPGDTVTYTNNWPHEPLVGNTITGDALVWTGVSVILLLAGIGAMAWWHSARPPEPLPEATPESDPLIGAMTTPSQRATVKYFWVVSALILVQILLGVIAAHYGVEGDGFYGIPLSQVLPYVLARTWHTQLGVLWIATAWLAAGLYIAPVIGGAEPRGQRVGVDVLFGALLLVVVGSMVGQWLSVMQKLGTGDAWFYFGHSGYEYIELGRAFQIGLFVGLLLWLGLVARAIGPALRRRDEQRPILVLFTVASVAIAGFYGAALAYGKHTNLAIAEYWRWWVVHLWVEGFFEVFATVVITFLFARLGLVRLATAGRSVLLASTIFLSGGIIGTLHHLYFSGTPTFVLALGSVFSALEVVPLMFVGFEAWENLRLSRARPWVQAYKWPIYFFIAVAFWNTIGAGLFGFMINPPVALYYMQGLNTTPVHGHTALFGVYGMLGIGLMLFCLRALRPGLAWREGWIAAAFWAINGGLAAMVMLSLLPIGLLQTQAAVDVGYWYARSSEFLQSGVMDVLRWLRIVGDTVFALGAVTLVAFVAALATGHAYRRP
ncbi:nitric-oxide reductase large subunit [Nannocystis sp. ILAH1]|uniref:nitric-oxide reductase large subunit n=1 Tax=Nannocystis sp. ILAH1 TaxID=2996789 RepID=UPI00226F3AAC|nr:nitric-oxide reductase large subunit [Nannocystis sp. ILAH1]MCY0989333.1 nitric-oxide reductase large subunit [Nannocystis sp. ILAH1]